MKCPIRPIVFRRMVVHQYRLTLYDKISDSSKLKQFADDKINVNEKLKLLLGRVGNFVGKEENAGIAFSSFPTMFSKGFLYRVVKSHDCVVKS